MAAIRPGVFWSVGGHAGVALVVLAPQAPLFAALLMALGLTMCVPKPPELIVATVVPVEVVDVSEISNVRALSTQQGEENAPLTAEEVQEEAVPEPTPSPEPAPRQQPRRQQDSFDLSAIAGMVNREQTQPRRQDGAAADRNRQGAGAGTAETAAIEDRLRALARAHITRNQCWRMPVDLPNPETLVVTVQFDLNRNGTLRGQPRVTSPSNYTFNPYMRTAAEAALRAVRACDPFPFADDPVVGDRYDLWREMEYTFRPSL